MCGIIGFTGCLQAAPILLNGLQKLEYRGYDSAGIACMSKGGITVSKAVGRIDNLRGITNNGSTINSTMGIGHTRWATHGKPSDVNSHPHVSMNGKFAVVHNGIIENFGRLKEILISKGFKFQSETDTEVVAHMLEYYYRDGNILHAIARTMNAVEGSYALGILCDDDPDHLYCAKKDSPLIIGLNDS
ncbi:MAG: glutamine--fructose-6-phosphate aminotransferase, partial [Firmicutes bacterium]|nr:glutamine--fructose-6-phosphate aminotransferase [Bacillota bacterium]